MNLLKTSLLSVITFGIAGYASVFAAGIDHFEVTLEPESAKTGEALDLTIEAVDKNNNIVTDYNGIILIFSESDPEAELPSALEDNSYVFTAADQGKVKFENSVKFRNTGTQDIHIYDLDDDTVLGVAEVNIEEDSEPQNLEIEILSPENGLIIGETAVDISGTTQKNHQISIILNGEEVGVTTSNSSGIYKIQIENLQNGENTIQTQVLDSDNVVVGASQQVKIQVQSNLPKLKSIKVNPQEVETESSYEIEVIANEGLTEVSVIIDDKLTKLEDQGQGVYSKNVYSPKEAGTYKIDVTLKDEIGHETKELGTESITVTAPVLEAPSEPAEVVTEVVEEPVEKTPDLTIKNIKVTELKTKSVVTWDTIDQVEGYNVYKKTEDGSIELIENVIEPRFEVEVTGDEVKHDFFAIKAIAKTASGEIYEGDLSEATKVQTGPEILILLLLSLFVGGFLFIAGNKKRA